MMVLSKSFVGAQGGGHPAGAAARRSRWSPPTPGSPRSGWSPAGCSAAVAAGVAALCGSPGALFFTAALAVVGAVLCLRIPRWVEVTEGEVPAALRSTARRGAPRAQPMGRGVVVALWGNGAIRVLTGFLTLFVAFVVKAQTEADPATPAAAASASSGRPPGSGSFVGNAIGVPAAVRPLRRPVVAVLHRGRGRGRGRWPRSCPGIATAAASSALVGGDGERAGQGLPGRGDPARPARGVARLGVRPLGDGAAAGLGVRRRAGRAAAARHLLARLRGGRRRWWRWPGCRPRWSAAAAACCRSSAPPRAAGADRSRAGTLTGAARPP